MKAKQLKRIVDFILQYHPNHTNKTIRALLKSDPEQFINVLSDAIDQADVIPSSVMNFMKEVRKQTQQIEQPTSSEQDQLIKENPIMKNQKKTSIIMHLVVAVKSAWVKAIQLLTGNAGQVKLVVSASMIAVIAIVTSKGTAVLTLIAALKSKGLIQSIISLFNKGINLLKSIKDIIVGKLSVLTGIIQMGGLIMLDKVIASKNFIISKVKQAWIWIAELFSVDSINELQQQAA